jgi:hypothetical protein
MKLKIQAVLAGLTWVAASGCVVTEPGDGAVRDPAAPVSFSGYTLFPSQGVKLESRNAAGTFQQFTRTRADDTPLVLSDGSRLYPWDVAAVVPNWHGSGCDRSAEVRAVAAGTGIPLMTFDEQGAQCVSDALRAGTPFKNAVDTCAAQKNNTLTLRAGAAVITGDVVITTQAEADALACATTIDGDLTVRPAGPVVSLPNLQQVTGDVLIDVQDTGSPSTVERADLPALQSIGGSLKFHHVSSGYNAVVNLGLPALTSLPGDLELILGSFNGQYTGPVNLQSVGGNVTIAADGDFYAWSLLGSLQAVGGDLLVTTTFAGSSANILVSLQTVGGSVTLDGLDFLGGGNVLDALHTVGGDLTVRGSAWNRSGFLALTSVGGTLHVDSSGASTYGPNNPSPQLGSASVSLDALLLTKTQFKSVPFAAATVGASGSITITNNSEMCPTSVDAFVAAQQQAGWSGTLTTSNNAGSCN